jgi:hypothetical protein
VQVINAYIALLYNIEHLHCRFDGYTIMEKTFNTELIARDGLPTVDLAVMYSDENNRKRTFESRICSYLDADMVTALTYSWYIHLRK